MEIQKYPKKSLKDFVPPIKTKMASESYEKTILLGFSKHIHTTKMIKKI
jgi:hypothetical protein